MRIGCDLVHIPRIEKLLDSENFAKRIFHPDEITYCEARASKVSSYAARFAAKEAFAKALGTGLYAAGVAPHDIWITNEESGRPILNLASHVWKIVRAYGHANVEVSLSHQVDYAMATVLFF